MKKFLIFFIILPLILLTALIKKDNSYHFENDILDKFEHLLKIESIGDKL